MVDRDGEFSFFLDIHVRIDIRIDISFFLRPYDLQIWQAGTSTGFDSNQAGAVDVITSRSHDKLKTLYLYYQSAYGYQTWQDGNLPWWVPAHKFKWPFDYVDF